jgi:integrase
MSIMQGVTSYKTADGRTRYVKTVELLRGADGKRRQTRVVADTKKGLDAKVTQLRASIISGGFGEADGSKLTVAQYMERWLEANARAVRPSTQQRYSDLLRLHALPFIGRIKLAKLTPLDVERLYRNRMTEGRLSPTTVGVLHCVLHKSLRQAIRWGLLMRNVTEAVEPPRDSVTERPVWDEDQLDRFLTMAEQDELGALFLLAALTGMRRGEVLGLTWGALSLAEGELSVVRTIIRGTDGGKFTFSEPKTQKGKRRIALPSMLVEALQKHRCEQMEIRRKMGGKYRTDLDLVFVNADGTPVHPNTLRYQFNRLIAKAGVPRIPFHSLRHTHATLMLLNGEHPRVVQERLGHSDVSITLNRYSHVTPQMQRDAADRLDFMLKRVRERTTGDEAA